MDEPEARATPEVLQLLCEAFPEEWREDPLGWDGVLAWEAEQRVTLPEPYRSFIAEVSNGSALGPPEDGGLLPLGWMPHRWPDRSGPRDPATAFPLEYSWYWHQGADEPRQDNITRYEHVHRHGSIPLGTEAVGMEWILVTAGVHCGSVWALTEVGACPYDGVTEQPWATRYTGIGFLDWVRQWRDGKGRFAQ